jgi:acyl-CoA synthetase (AMP-forming)/AMP-acid ligase II/thioesterase domain-containing protein
MTSPIQTTTTRHDLLFSRITDFAEQMPHRDALIGPDGSALSYAQISTMLRAMETLLLSLGLQQTDVIAVVLPDALCCLISIMGTAQVCVCAPINPALAASELEKDLRELGAVGIMIEDQQVGLREVAVKLGLTVITASRTTNGFGWRAETCSTSQRAAIELPTDTVLLLHTSATTGRRKVVPLTDANVHAMLGNATRALRLTPDDRLLLMAKLFHIQGVVGAWAQMWAGGSVIAGVDYSPQAFQSSVTRMLPTWYTGGPTLHRAVLSNIEQYPIPKPSSLRFVRSGGAMLPGALASELEHALGVPILDVYGLTEVGGITSTTLDDPPTPTKSVGRSTGPEVAILGKDGEFLGAGEEGQVVVRGPNVMHGYLNDPEANREAFRNGWFLTGDLGRLDEEGFLYITGRIKEIINRGGQKLIPDEVDAVLITHRAIREVATFPVAHTSLGEDVACAIILREGLDVHDEELREFAAGKLSPYKIPRVIYRLDAIPRGATGKPQRLVLRDRFSKAAETATVHADPARTHTAMADRQEQTQAAVTAQGTPTDLLDSLTGIWRRCLNLDEIGVNEDFFAIGGDSIVAVTMLAEVESLFSLTMKLSDSQFFRKSTLSNLHQLTLQAIAGDPQSLSTSRMELVPVVQRRQAAITFYMIPSDGAEGFSFRELGRFLEPAWSLCLLRPGTLWHARSASSIQDAAAEAAALILAQEAQGTCVIGGFCFGGVVAFETARVLETHGKRSKVILFDVPAPGYPRLVQDCPEVAGAVFKTVKACLSRREVRPILSMVRRLMRRVAWVTFRELQPQSFLWKIQPLRWISEQSRAGYFSFMRLSPISAPILHIMATDAQDPLLEESRHAWKQFSQQPVRTEMLPGAHDTMFRGTNVQFMVQHIAGWLQGSETDNRPDRSTTCSLQ